MALDEFSAARQAPPFPERACGRGLAVCQDQGGDPAVQSLVEVAGRRCGPLECSDHPVPPAAHCGLDGAEELAGTHELLPPGQDLPAQQAAVAHSPANLVQSPLELLVAGSCQGEAGGRLLPAGPHELLSAAGQGRHRTPKGLRDDDLSGDGVVSESLEPRAQPTRHVDR